MTSKARTIDNLGVDTSVRYAQDQKSLDQKFLEDATFASSKSEIISTVPSFPMELEILFGFERKISAWADFLAPPDYTSLRSSLFSFQLIPGLGTLEKQELKIEKIENFRKRKKKKKAMTKEEDEEEKEKEVLLKLLLCIKSLEKNLELINARRNQYHKG
jgi:hypothetical protein